MQLENTHIGKVVVPLFGTGHDFALQLLEIGAEGNGLLFGLGNLFFRDLGNGLHNDGSVIGGGFLLRHHRVKDQCGALVCFFGRRFLQEAIQVRIVGLRLGRGLFGGVFFYIPVFCVDLGSILPGAAAELTQYGIQVEFLGFLPIFLIVHWNLQVNPDAGGQLRTEEWKPPRRRSGS